MSREALCLDGAVYRYKSEIQKAGVPNHVAPQEEIVFFKVLSSGLRVHGKYI